MVVSRKKKADSQEIRTEILLRLANFNYVEKPSSKKIHINPLLLKTTMQKEFEKWIKNDPLHKIHTPDRTYQNGWVFLDHIERTPCPYGSPQAHRHEYLTDQFIEKAELLVSVKKPGKKNRQIYRPKVYRIKRDKRTRKAMEKLFAHDIRFFNSDYYHDTRDEEEDTLKGRAGLINTAVALISREGYPTDKRFYENLFTTIDNLKKSLEKPYLNARDYSPEERRERSKARRKKLMGILD